jgi:hypothetical protein
MLLDRQRSINIFTSIVLTSASATAYVNMFTLDNANARLLTLLMTMIISGICMRLLHLALRVEPISAIYREFTDQQLLLALFQQAPMPTKKSAGRLDTFQIDELPLTNYLFTGNNAKENRQRIAARLLSRFPGAYIIEPKTEMDKMRLISDITERKSTDKRDKPLIIFSDNYDAAIDGLDRLGVYCFVAGDFNIPINRKILDAETAKKLDPESEVTLGLYDGGKTIKQLL